VQSPRRPPDKPCHERRRKRFSAPTSRLVVLALAADGNRSFNRSGIGLPAEGYGFSNNAPAIFRLPSFSRVRIAVPRTGMGTSIRLRYP
jgi:uncharacterized protein (DUF2141 family)